MPTRFALSRAGSEENNEDGMQGLLRAVFFFWETFMSTFCKNKRLPLPSETGAEVIAQVVGRCQRSSRPR